MVAADLLAATAAQVLPPPLNFIFGAVYDAEQAVLQGRLPRPHKFQHALALARRSGSRH